MVRIHEQVKGRNHSALDFLDGALPYRKFNLTCESSVWINLQFPCTELQQHNEAAQNIEAQSFDQAVGRVQGNGILTNKQVGTSELAKSLTRGEPGANR